MTAILGLVGLGFGFLAYDALDKSGLRVALFGALAAVCFFATIAGTPTRPGGGTDCYIDWDARSNSSVCD